MSDHKERNLMPSNCMLCGANSASVEEMSQCISFEGISSLNHAAVVVPALVCDVCGFVGTLPEAEDKIDEMKKIKRRETLGEEITKIRESTGMSRAAWLELTRIGDASLTRWETGAKDPNPGYLQFLYLLKFPDNLRRLKDKAERINQALSLLTNFNDQELDEHVPENDYSHKFPGSQFGERELSGQVNFALVA